MIPAASASSRSRNGIVTETGWLCGGAANVVTARQSFATAVLHHFQRGRFCAASV